MVISFMRVLQVNAVNAIRSTGRNCGEMSYYIKVHDGGCFTAYSDGPHTENSYRISSVFECKKHGGFVAYNRIARVLFTEINGVSY